MEQQQNKRVLIVEDERDVIEIYKIDLEQEGFIVDSSFTGRGALDKIKDFIKSPELQPALIILDLLLPDISGIEVLKKLKGDPKTADIPVLILTNYSSDKIRELVESMKNTEYLLKINISPLELVQVIRKKLSS
ncbi:MAG: hypothetical protein A3H06_00115 [Candidatus Colwellbacteria bacterium RIFCSPLOWO2_12_FULL_44_13]|uniref:Response regulatory domain-containing protein n=3 Tax=Candidatus Colwelliibacteriota TaxID=1817904 RepID=A0A1G1Z9F8_9BACT|nr:MAG: hypothetical protein A3F24_02750 [Candidatus Colwellbacteria bacterium RIFCSPHIGHO2_12_FULL_44_17]OGY60726.1 MAG: hypothetical protein A3I31_02665 [Candidatus Colwellbacteria bacterium RIFCSPLOWO2_02_FULL_44_20b]OGY62020.1 MAG: hypothetical protein A3H06_00115 [Candidatus Colwellbacteria bacterium RIFCSPLOWO2_12_FULL_44_13]